MPSIKTLICWSCKQEVELPEKITRTVGCPKCDQPLKCCYNCRFYDRDAYHACNEPQAEWVRYKEKANFCEYFTPRSPITKVAPAQKSSANPRNNGTDSKPQKDRTKSAWDNLFKE
jgi:hypothetical protein